MASLPACATTSSTPAIGGAVEVRSATLGAFRFSPDRCDWRAELDAVDFTARSLPAVTVRVVGARRLDPPAEVIVANRAAPGGAREESLTAAQCTVLRGYSHPGRGEVSAGSRFECTLPSGGTVSGLVAAGACE